ncbi:MAG: hypothetical protein M0Z50_07770 [Planctomycetia bacterium]|nr:hypothetical protein [Planctomycetia bacterium]
MIPSNKNERPVEGRRIHGITVESLLEQLRKYAPWIPAIIAAQLLSNLVAGSTTDKNSGLFQSIFGRRVSLLPIVLIAYAALQDMRKSTVTEFQEELKSFTGFSSHREADNPFVVTRIGEGALEFIDLHELTQFLGKLGVNVKPDRASRSFDTARRTVIPGWNDEYLLRAAEFLATRSIEQSMHAIFPKTSNDHDYVTPFRITLDECLKWDGTPTPNGRGFVEFLLHSIPGITNLYETFDGIIKDRNNFAHRCEASQQAPVLDLAPFQLASACLQYRNQVS